VCSCSVIAALCKLFSDFYTFLMKLNRILRHTYRVSDVLIKLCIAAACKKSVNNFVCILFDKVNP